MEFFLMTILPIACIVFFVTILVAAGFVLAYFLLSGVLIALLWVWEQMFPRDQRQDRAQGRALRGMVNRLW